MPASSPTRSPPPPARASWPAPHSTPAALPSTSGGSRGPSWTRAPAPSSSGWRSRTPNPTRRPDPAGSAEEVLGVGADDLVSDGAVAEPGGLDATDDGDGDVSGLAHHQLGGRRQLVGDGDFRCLQRAPPSVFGAPQVDDGGDARAPKGDVDQAASPRAAEGVGHHDGDSDAGAGGEGVTDVTGRAIGVDR